MDIPELLEQMAQLGSEQTRRGMARFGINTEKAFGISVASLRTLAKACGKDEELSEALWRSGYHEARILSFFVLPRGACTPQLMEQRLPQFDSWDLCDQACVAFATHPMALATAAAWSDRAPEFEKRAAFSLMACAAVHQKQTADAAFLPLLDLISRHAADPRRYVFKAANWALRQIGKRSAMLHAEAIRMAATIHAIPNKTARWIASDALRELTREATLARLRR